MTLVKITKGPKTPDQSLAYEDMHAIVQGFQDTHKTIVEELSGLEQILTKLQEQGPDKAANEALGKFFKFFDSYVLPHNREQEDLVFEFLEAHAEPPAEDADPDAMTVIEILREEHTHLIRMGAVMFNFFGVAGHLPDQASQRVIIEAGIRQGETLVDMFRMHIYREDKLCSSAALSAHLAAQQ